MHISTLFSAKDESSDHHVTVKDGKINHTGQYKLTYHCVTQGKNNKQYIYYIVWDLFT